MTSTPIDETEHLFIAISGLIGSGKTTLATSLAEVMGLPAYYEPVTDNEYLADFYKDTARHSFPMQVYLLNSRFQQHQQIIWQGKGGVQDRSIYEDGIFAKMLADSGAMSERDYRCYRALFANMSNFMRKPNLIVHLDISAEQSLERIKKRGRPCEASITLEYLQALHAGYDAFIAEISRVIPVIRVNWTDFKDPKDVALVIQRKWREMTNVHRIDWHESVRHPPSSGSGFYFSQWYSASVPRDTRIYYRRPSDEDTPACTDSDLLDAVDSVDTHQM